VLRDATGDPGLQVVVGPAASHIVPGDATSLTAADLLALEAEARFPLELTRLRGDLREALRLTEASRSRIALAADDERGRIQRDLHDGAQQNLVALGMRLRQMERHPETPPTAPDLAEAVELVQRTIAELRSLAQGVRPSSLDDGLEPALRAMARTVPVRVDLDLAPVAVAEPSATAAYYMAAEAVTNALKHSQATRIAISLAQDAEGTRVRVQDDGCGGAVVSGSGLAGIRDRVEAAGGLLVVDSVVASGTRVEAIFPRAA
jgi:signal transduction histidine kinase